jgi:hypothetical protein
LAVLLCHWIKKSAVGKIKNTKGSVPKAIGIGSVAVCLRDGLNAGHQSKWFVFI